MNKYLFLGIVLVVGVALDLITKTWAENNLATEARSYDHFIYRSVDAASDGMTLGDWAEQKFGAPRDSVNWQRTVLRSGVVREGTPGDESARVELGGPGMLLSANDVVEIRQRQIEVVPGFWNHVYVRNPGAAWGIFADRDESFRRPFFLIVTVLALLLMGWIYHTTRPYQRIQLWALALILAGAIGNLVDRVRYGYVIDFIDWYITWGGQERHWPTFNIADAWISIGFVLLLWIILRGEETDPDAPAEEASGTEPKPETVKSTDEASTAHGA